MDPHNPPYADLVVVESIPPLPATAATLLQLATDEDVEVNRLAQVIERDPPLCARLLGIANSAFYAPRLPVLTVKEAIVRVLGLNVVRNIALGMSLTAGFSTAACPHFDLTGYWLLALGTADLASGLARAATIADAPCPDAAYLVGLLHNIGELLLVHLWPERMDEALCLAAASPETSLVEHERAVIGIDHWAAGAFLARHWQLPELVADSAGHFDEPLSSPEQRPMLHLLRAARRWVAGVSAGRPDSLRVSGVDATYCEYRAMAFVERYDALNALARSLAR